MPPQRAELTDTLEQLRADLHAQGRRVRDMIANTVVAIFERDAALARAVIESDNEIDRVDVALERRTVELLRTIAAGCELGDYELRLLLTIVKVNNELERIGDLGVYICERVDAFTGSVQPAQDPPPKFRLLANSVIGMLDSTNHAVADLDAAAARLVLSSDDATEAFKSAIMREVEEGLAQGRHEIDYAFTLNRVAAGLGGIADHCTNIAEQVIYVTSGKIVRHRSERWSDPEEPLL